MTISEINERLNDIYMDIEKLTQVNKDDRIEVNDKLESIMNTLDEWIDIYPDNSEDDEYNSDDENEEDEY
jgi:hypothetical protein